jgi:hypothetical protein
MILKRIAAHGRYLSKGCVKYRDIISPDNFHYLTRRPFHVTVGNARRSVQVTRSQGT